MRSKSRKWKLLFLVFCLTPFLLSGCWSSRQIDNLVYPFAIGVDYEEGQVVVYVSFLSFTSLAKAEIGGGRQEANMVVVEAKGETFDIATDNIYASAPMEVSWAHVKTIVLSEAALKAGIVHDLVDVVDRFSNIRQTLWIHSTPGDLPILFNTKTMLNISPFYSRLSTPMGIYEQFSTIKPLRLHQFVGNLYNTGETVALSSLTVNEKDWDQDKENLPVIEAQGYCFLKEQSFQDCLPREKLNGMKWVQKGVERTPLYLRENGKVVGSFVIMGPSSNIKYKWNEENKPVFSISIKAKGSTIELIKERSEDELLKLMEKQIKTEVLETYSAAAEKNIDVYNFLKQVYLKEPEKLEKLKDFQLSPETLEKIEVKVEMDTSGNRKLRTIEGMTD